MPLSIILLVLLQATIETRAQEIAHNLGWLQMPTGFPNLAYAKPPPYANRPKAQSKQEDKAAKARAKLSAVFPTEHFVVHHDPSDSYLARLMARGAEEHLKRISKELGCTLERARPFPLYIYSNHMDFINAVGLETQKFTVGTAAWNEVISIDASGVFEPADRVMAHEITHAVVFRLLGRQSSRLPLWFNEGLAKHLSEEFTDRDLTTVANAAADGNLIPLELLRNSFPERRLDIAYAASHLAIKYLVRKYGKSAPKKILAELAKGLSFDEAMQKTIGISADQFESDWYESAMQKYHPLRVAQLLGALIWVIIAGLAVAAFLIRRKQKIEAARRWEEEEFDERMRRILGQDRHR